MCNHFCSHVSTLSWDDKVETQARCRDGLGVDGSPRARASVALKSRRRQSDDAPRRLTLTATGCHAPRFEDNGEAHHVRRTRGPMNADTPGDAFSPGELEAIAERASAVIANVAKVILGKDEVIQASVVALLAGGHLIIEDYPGVGKTLLAKSLARSVDCRFTRIQFTPDLLPSDVTGVSVFDQRTTQFEFRPGPIFANIVLADEINRSSPKTQASLLESMEERQVTIDDVTHPIAPPFMVIATQNPIEYEGTYPLPEAQLDRFMMRLSLGYPTPEAEQAVLEAHAARDPLAELTPVVEGSEVLAMQAAVGRVQVVPELRRYVVELLGATRESRDVYLGASPRAGIALVRAAKALALLKGRAYVVPQDVKDLAGRVLSHRIILAPEARVHGQDEQAVVARLLEAVPVPGP